MKTFGKFVLAAIIGAAADSAAANIELVPARYQTPVTIGVLVGLAYLKRSPLKPPALPEK